MSTWTKRSLYSLRTFVFYIISLKLLKSAIPIGYKPTISCNHGAGASCPNCSEYVKSDSKEIASWLCNHPEYAFCPKCQPPPDEDIQMGSTPQKTCECTGSQKCVKCLNLKAAYKVDVIPYAQMMAEKRALCKYKHDSSTTCPLCGKCNFQD